MGTSIFQQQHTETNIMKLLVFLAIASVAHSQSLPEVLTREGATTLVDFVVKAGLAETLSGDGPFTVFAPTNEAFERLPQSTVDALIANPELLKKVLLYHVVPAEVRSSAITEDDTLVDSAEGSKLRVNVYMKKFYYDGFITVNGKRVSRTDVTASNGVVHFITDVIDVFANEDCTEVLTKDGRFGTLLTAVTKANLVETLQGEGPFTIFAPTDSAFQKIPADTLDAVLADDKLLSSTLLRHVVPAAKFAKGVVWEFLDTAGGETIATHVFKGGYTKVVSEVDGKRTKAKIIDTDLICSNGVVHAIDTVI